jgi:RecQ family ATP-dependent DNA helicase
VPGVAIRELDKVNGERQGHAEGGITLVVSPLIALMKDQVDALKRLGIRAEAMDSTKTREQYLATVDAMREGGLDILYCAPERLNNEGFVASMASVKGGVRLLAVDEAHCISEWGHAFRPDYLKVARFAKEIQAERVVCLTATATPKVAQDVCKAFDIPPSEGVFRTATYRDNLKLQARSFETKDESFPELLSFLRQHPGPTIIYVTLQKHAEGLSARLRTSKVKSRHYHAGMDKDEKSSCQDEFMSSKNMVICATIAFGMGIDKADIRNVIHYDFPSSLEGYSQEIGRAGRDGKQSYCMLFLCAEDFHLRESFARGDLPSKKSVRSIIQQVFSKKVSGTGKGMKIEMGLRQVSGENDIKVRPYTGSHAREATMTASSVILPY